MPEHGVPVTLVEEAIKGKQSNRRARRNSFERDDEFWVVFDHDEHPNVRESLARARDHNIGVAYSNPCFELWAVLHLQDYDAPADRHEMQSLLKKLMPHYEECKCFDYNGMRLAYEDAVRRAARMDLRRQEEGAPLGNPFTGVYRLTILIRDNGQP
jgi:hypothetical protein